MGEPTIAAPVGQPFTSPPPAIHQTPATPLPPAASTAAPDTAATATAINKIVAGGNTSGKSSDASEIKIESRSLGQKKPTNSPGYEPVGTLSVGDSFASSAQNSQITANAANDRTPGQASLSVRIGVPTSSPNIEQKPGTASVDDNKPAEAASTNKSVPHYWVFDGGELRIYHPESSSYVPVSHTHNQRIPQFHTENPQQGVSSVGTPPPTWVSYRLNIFDVHDLGGPKSAIHIKSKDGRLLRRVELKPGNSEIDVDLPPGDYTFEAIAGKRTAGSADPKKDDRDNLTVEVSKKK